MINSDELLFVVDENNNPLEPKPRSQVHKEGIWHRNSHIWISNSRNEILCQQRSFLKDTSPGKWEAFFGGHLGPGIEYIDGALAELSEELGIETKPENLHLIEIYKRDVNFHREFEGIFHLLWDGDINSIKFEKEEVEQLKWVSLEEAKHTLLEEQNPNWTLMGYEKEVFEYIEKLNGS